MIILDTNLSTGNLVDFSTSGAGGGSIGVDSLIYRYPPYSLWAQAISTGVSYAQYNHAGTVAAVGAWLWVDAYPALRRCVMLTFYGSEGFNASIDIDSTGILYAKLGANGTETSQSGPRILAQSWHTIQYLLSSGQNPQTVSWMVDGVAQTGLSGNPDPGGDPINDSRFGATHGGAGIPAAALSDHMDRIIVANAATDYPLPLGSFPSPSDAPPVIAGYGSI